jgi:hypothetical protein
MSDHHASACVGGCTYHRLYNDSRESLNDLNQKLVEAVGRHGRLRNNLVSALRRCFPQEFLAVERTERRRMSDQPDEVILRYLTQWIAAGAGTLLQDDPPTNQLRVALVTAGFHLPPGGDLDAWAASVRGQHAAGQQDSVPGPDGTAITDVADADSSARLELVGIFDPYTQARAVAPHEPVGPGPVDRTHPSASDDLLALLTPAPAGRSLRDAAGAAAATKASVPTLSAEETAAVTDPKPALVVASAVAPAGVSTGPDAADSSSAVAAGTAGDAEPAVAAGAAVVPAVPARRQGQQGAAIRPQLMPKPDSSKTRRRRPKATTTANAAGPAPDVDVPQSDATVMSEDVPEGLHARALELACRPRPLFTRDLVALGAGTAAEVEAWEQSCRDADSSPVRFLPPKARHRQRGALVIPADYTRNPPAEFRRSPWAQLLAQFRGGRLFELAIVLDRVYDTMLSMDVHASHVVLRLNQPRGLVGIVVTTDPDHGPEDSARAVLSDTIQKLLATPLSLLAVLATNATSLPGIITALEEEALARAWEPGCPLMAQLSWEYAADRGQTATLVLDG